MEQRIFSSYYHNIDKLQQFSVNLDMWKGLVAILLISLALTVHIRGVFRILSNIQDERFAKIFNG